MSHFFESDPYFGTNLNLQDIQSAYRNLLVSRITMAALEANGPSQKHVTYPAEQNNTDDVLYSIRYCSSVAPLVTEPADAVEHVIASMAAAMATVMATSRL